MISSAGEGFDEGGGCWDEVDDWDFCACLEKRARRSAVFPVSSSLVFFWARVRGFSGLADGLGFAPFFL